MIKTQWPNEVKREKEGNFVIIYIECAQNYVNYFQVFQ